MNQENFMPIKFQAWNVVTKTMIDLKKITPFVLDMDTDGLFIPLSDGLIILQAIGATSSDDPPQELYLGDVVKFWWLNWSSHEPLIGEVIWKDWCVCLKYFIEGNGIRYLPFNAVYDAVCGDGIKKLGSRYDLKMKEILEKVGLEES